MLEPLEIRIAPAALIFAHQTASGFDFGTHIGLDSRGNTYVAGTFDGSIDIDPGPGVRMLTTQETDAGGNPIGSDIYIAKYAADGSLLWANTWGGVGPGRREFVADIAVVDFREGATQVFVLGDFNSNNAGFGGSGPLNFGGSGAPQADVVLLKLNGSTGAGDSFFDNDGMLQFGGSAGEFAGGLTASGSGVLVTGTYASVDAGFNRTAIAVAPAVGRGDVFVFRVDRNTGAPDVGFAVGGVLAFGTTGEERGVDLEFVSVPESTADFFLHAKEAGGDVVRRFNSQDGQPILSFGNAGVLPIDGLNAIAVDRGDRLLAVGNSGGASFVARYAGDGLLDTDFGNGGKLSLGSSAQRPQSIAIAADDSIVIAGTKDLNPVTSTSYFIAKVGEGGSLDSSFGTGGFLKFGATGSDGHHSISVAIDEDGLITAHGFFSGTTDIDPTKGRLTVTASQPGPLVAHGPLDTFLVRIDGTAGALDSANPLTVVLSGGQKVRLALAGTGYSRVTVAPDGSRIEQVEFVDTDLTSKFRISIRTGTPAITIDRIVTAGENQDLGFLKLGKNVRLGDGVADDIPDIRITGASSKILLDDINANALIRLGDGLPYNVVGDDTTPDTYNQRPDLRMDDILGPGVVISLLGDGTEEGRGGGGLRNVTVGSWGFEDGFIKTTQSIGKFRLKRGDCFTTFELDKDGLGTNTVANMGAMTISAGSWGSSGSEIEGELGSFSATSFLAGATISAASINKFLVKNGSYAGTTTLTNPDAPGMKSFTVNGDYVGYVGSEGSIINVNIKGDFKGSLLAKSIGSITAYAIDGTTVGDLTDDPLRHNIVATSGSLGTLKTTAGGIKNMEVIVNTIFNGFSITHPAANSLSVGLDNVRIEAGQINKTNVTLTAGIAIKNSVFESLTSIGTITTKRSVEGSLFAAGSDIGAITIGSAATPTASLTTSRFLAGALLGLDGLFDGDEVFTRSGKIGNVTVLGAFATTTLAAGIDPIDGIYGNGNDVNAPGTASGPFAIGVLKFGTASGVLTASPGLAHTEAIEAATIKSIKIGSAAAVSSFVTARYLQAGGAEASSDVLVRLV